MKKLLLLIFFFTLFSNAQTIALQSFATSFVKPVNIVNAGDTRLFVLEQAGKIKILNANGTINATPFLDISSIVTTLNPSYDERGLLGLVFHPNYATNGYFYVNYTRAGDNATVIARYSVSANPNIADASSGSVLLTVAQPFSNHNGGTIKFGPDGYLYIGMGDGGSSGDPGNRAQNINENLGKMLRIDVDSASPYGIPPTNPYVGIAGNDEIWAIGLRNPWKFSFNRLNGDLWIADVGQNTVEEIDKITSPLPVGLNFGWNCFEGSATYPGTGPCPTYASTVTPFAQYTHAATNGCSITGGFFYTGTTYPNFANKYFFADYCTNKIGTANTAGVITWTAALTGGGFTTFGEDINGELYIASSNGTIYKIIDTSLSISEFEKNGFSLYPNPAKTEVFIKNKTGATLSKVKVFDLTGKLVLTQVVENNETNPSVNISALSGGLYLISVEDVTGNRYQSKLVVE